MTREPHNIVIRAAAHANAEAILQLHRASILVLGAEHYSLAEVESWATGLVAERYVTAMTDGGETFIVAAASEGELAGFCSFKDDEVKGLYVAPRWARLGVGSALLRRAEAAIAATGCRRICIGASLSGQAFYERHGYRVTDRHGWTSRGGLVMAALAMENTLP